MTVLHRGAAVLAVPLFLSACGGPGERVSDPPPGLVRVRVDLPRGGFLDCGPEALAAVLRLNGQAADVKEISGKICDRASGGTTVADLATYAADRGLMPRPARGATIETLRASLERGVPPICMVNATPRTFHFYVVVGVVPGRVVVADYDGGVRIFSEREFAARWRGTGRLTVLIGPAEVVRGIPHDEDAWLRELEAAGEPAQPKESLSGQAHAALGALYEAKGFLKLAKFSYRFAVDRDPGQVGAALALGNLLYGEGKIEEAAGVFRRGAWADGSCANNLAWILSEHQGKAAEARAWARAAETQAVALSMPWFQSLDTQATIALRLGEPAEAAQCWEKGGDAIPAAPWTGLGAQRESWYRRAAEAASAAGRPEDADRLARKAAGGR